MVMHGASRTRDALLFASTYVFPAVAFPFLAWRFLVETGSWPFTLVALGVPLVFGYAMPLLGVARFRRWSFTRGLRVGGIYVHHGFVYASKLAFVLWLGLLTEPASLAASVAVVLLCAGAVGFGGWWHDVHAVRAGRIVLADADPAHPDAAVTKYAPLFWLMGATYAALGLVAHRVLVLDGRADAWPWLFVGGLVTLSVVSGLAFLALDPRPRAAPRSSTDPLEVAD